MFALKRLSLFCWGTPLKAFLWIASQQSSTGMSYCSLSMLCSCLNLDFAITLRTVVRFTAYVPCSVKVFRSDSTAVLHVDWLRRIPNPSCRRDQSFKRPVKLRNCEFLWRWVRCAGRCARPRKNHRCHRDFFLHSAAALFGSRSVGLWVEAKWQEVQNWLLSSGIRRELELKAVSVAKLYYSQTWRKLYVTLSYFII